MKFSSAEIFLTSYICTPKVPGEMNDIHVVQDTIINSLKWNTWIPLNLLNKGMFLDTKTISKDLFCFD